MNLEENNCTPCHTPASALTEEKINTLMKELSGEWHHNPKGHLERTLSFDNFSEAMAFANKVADAAERQGHHPDLHISWGKCEIEIWTHFLNGLSENDFYLASKIEKLIKP